MIKVRLAKGIQLRKEDFGGIVFFNDKFMMLGKDSFFIVEDLHKNSKTLVLNEKDTVVESLIKSKLLIKIG